MFEAAKSIVTLLQQSGYRAYVAGGAVRDMLLGIVPKDYDIVTSATPEHIEAIFPHVRPVGKQFGVMIVSMKGEDFEVATFRAEQGYSDKRRPDNVRWTHARGDVERRDFSMNGLLYDPVTKQVLDYVHGQRDIAERLVRFIGAPDERVAEDPLRILRGID